MANWPRKTSFTIVCFCVLIAALAAWKRIPAVQLLSVLDFQPRPGDLPSAPEPEPVLRASTPGRLRTPMPTEDNLREPSGALDAFYRSLQRTESGRGVTRILHYGDSPVTADSITADMRSLLQQRFGDAGHGFVLVSKPWAWYGHRGVELKGAGWRIQPATQGERAKDGLHGLGGVAFEGGPGARSTIRLESEPAWVEVSYLARPGGGAFSLHSGEQTVGTVQTEAEQTQPAWSRFPLPPHARELAVQVDSGTVRLFGLSFEANRSGVIYNSLGLNGGQVQVIVRFFDAAHWTAQLQHQRPDLVILNYGTNESVYPKYLDTYYAGELRSVIQRVQAAVPHASILVMGPMDRGQRGEDGSIITMPTVPHVVEIQSRVAGETGCAFFNTFAAMGGEGTMGRWYANRPQLVTADFMHPFPAGARRIGLLLDEALMRGYERFKAHS